MSRDLYSVDQVAELLGLHVKTVRLYVRDGRLKATRIGKQYRIAREDLEALTGKPVGPLLRDSVRRTRHVAVSTVVHIDAISPDQAVRLGALLAAAVNGGETRIDTSYDEVRGQLKIIISSDVATTAGLLGLIALGAGEKS